MTVWFPTRSQMNKATAAATCRPAQGPSVTVGTSPRFASWLELVMTADPEDAAEPKPGRELTVALAGRDR